eukprot:5072852-Alexandrium_andersonii.AAC.1
MRSRAHERAHASTHTRARTHAHAHAFLSCGLGASASHLLYRGRLAREHIVGLRGPSLLPARVLGARS